MFPAARDPAAGEGADGVRAALMGGFRGGGRGVDAGVDILMQVNEDEQNKGIGKNYKDL